MDIRSNTVVCDGLPMPHSPRLHERRLWVLDSGRGELGCITPDTTWQAFQAVTFCPGFVRGLALHGQFAVVGLSRACYDDFGDLALQRRMRALRREAWCGFPGLATEIARTERWVTGSKGCRERGLW